MRDGRHAALPPALLGALAFWGGILMAGRRYPAEFDWRYMTLSTLLSPRSNPAGYAWAAGGIGCAGVCLVAWTLTMRRRLGHPSASAPLGLWSLGVGSACMALVGFFPQRLAVLPRLHEFLTLLAFAGLCLGSGLLTAQAAEGVLGTRADAVAPRHRVYRAALAGVVAVPVFLAGLAQAYVFYVLPELHWVSLAWRQKGIPLYLSFAFWEWSTCALLFAYLGFLSVAWPMARGGSPTRLGISAINADQ